MKDLSFKEQLIIRLIKFLVEFVGRDVNGFWMSEWRKVFDEINS